MVQIYIVRHGEAAAKFGQHSDPGLSDRGRKQAMQAARELSSLGPLPIYSSPLQRTLETAGYLCRMWNTQPVIDKRFAEIPSPPELALDQRSHWLQGVMARGWKDLSKNLLEWRKELIETATKLPHDCVVFSHFIAINVLVGASQGSTALTSFQPGNASITHLSNKEGRLNLISLGLESRSVVN